MARKIGSIIGKFKEMDLKEVHKNDLSKEGFEELEEQDHSFGQWFRASPLPKLGEEVKKKDSSYNIRSKDIFNVPTKIIPNKEHPNKTNCVDVETVAKYIGAVVISTEKKVTEVLPEVSGVQKRKWVMRKRRIAVGGEEEETKCSWRGKSYQSTRGGVGRPTPHISMKTLSWNCRGLRSPRAVRARVRLMCMENPRLVFLMETKLKSEEVLRIKKKLNFRFDLIIDCKGVYGFPKEPNKRKTWQLVQSIYEEYGENVLFFGDFNDTTQDRDKIEGIIRSINNFSWNRQVLERCSLQVLGFEGYTFTLSNGRQGNDDI
ncbi:hypothetical protein KIW84_062953 [Lathyrus oleraceus]|uniref:Endonuclease/exonuclease/phosphatase domain-containing protein n=1 Tax=Pisum sativum TaxID=3888 RepID=A0A9D5A711_PEA|nr:hypothetical protein KIW84_062953 [Pisum sativum]